MHLLPRIATRYDKLASRFSFCIALVSSFIWLASLSTDPRQLLGYFASQGNATTPAHVQQRIRAWALLEVSQTGSVARYQDDGHQTQAARLVINRVILDLRAVHVQDEDNLLRVAGAVAAPGASV